MTGSAAEGIKGDASARKRCPERVTTGAGSMRVPGSLAVGSDSVGATGRGGRTGDYRTGHYSIMGFKGFQCSPMFIGGLNKKGSRSTGAAPPGLGCRSSEKGRDGLRDRHSSSNVTERLERTVLVAGK